MLHTNAISYTNKFSKIRKNIRLCKFKNKNTRILLDKIVLSLPAGNFLTRSFSILALFSFFHLEQLGFFNNRLAGYIIQKYSKWEKKNLGFSNYLQKIWKLYKCNFFSRMIKLYKHASKPWNRLIVWTVAAVVWC